MAAIAGSVRPAKVSWANSIPVKDASGIQKLHLKGGPGGDYRRPSYPTAQKRHYGDDGRSKASKHSRYSYSSRNTMRMSDPRARSTSNIASITKPENFFKPGIIVWADHFEAVYNIGSVNDPSIMQDPQGRRPISRKERLFIIIGAYAESYISLPVYSHNGAGTKNKPKPEEFVSLKDHRATVDAPRQSTHAPLVTVDMSGNLLMETSVVHLTYPVTRHYMIPVQVVGQLSLESTNQMIQLYKGYLPAEICQPAQPAQPDPAAQPAPTDQPAPPAQPAGTLLINADVSVSKVLKILRLQKYSDVFKTTGWKKAHTLKTADLVALGVTEPADRQKLTVLFQKVKVAMRVGPGWKLVLEMKNAFTE